MLLSKSPFLSSPDKQGGRKLDDGEERERDGSLDTAGMKRKRVEAYWWLIAKMAGGFLLLFSLCVCVCLNYTARAGA